MINGLGLAGKFRKNFAKIPEIIEAPNLIEVQKRSYDEFLQTDLPPEKRRNRGLQAVFSSVFPIWDFNRTASLEYKSYRLGEPKYTVEECRQRGMTYAAPIKVDAQLVVWDVDDARENRYVRYVKGHEVYFGEIPLMTENGTFIVNGTERVIVSQLHRSPGVFYDYDKAKSQASGKVLYLARIIPYRGSWLDFEFDHKDMVFVRIDRRRKLPVTTLFRALGCTDQEILNYFFQTEKVFIKGGKFFKSSHPEQLTGQRASLDVVDPKSKEVIVKAGKRMTRGLVKRIQAAGIDLLPTSLEDLVGKVVARDVREPGTKEVVLECNQELTLQKLEEAVDRGIEKFETLFIDPITAGPYIRDTLVNDRAKTQDEAMIEICRRLRPGDPPTLQMARALFESLFSRPERYDLSSVGRLKLNYKLKLNFPLSETRLTKEDILAAVKYLVDLKNGVGDVDDIDHLGNRRVRTVGELLENQYRIGLARLERAIKERMSLSDIETLMPHDLVNPKTVTAVIKEFFGSSQLSQFMDQTNPLSEITHKRRLSALGPGGLTRERAGFEVRDVHPTHYGRICPIETPEGPNIGLIASLSTFARINEFGFIETPYREVVDGKVTNKIRFLTALEEEEHAIAQANAPLDARGRFLNELVSCRRGGEFVMVPREEVKLMDVSPKQLVSVAAALVPFLEHDDANRALMGSNMQRQAVPLLKTEAPLIGTGMEATVARDSGVTVLAKRAGTIESVDASRMVIKVDQAEDAGVDIYSLIKYAKSNQNTCINQRPIVKVGEGVVKGQVIADGPATDMGELALGRNVLVAFMPWGGYNFEDSILISERLVKEDTFTSIHIEELEVAARETKLGKEEITSDIPNQGEEVLKDLDESGIIRIGAEVRPGDILVGKVTPKGEQVLYPEEKLLRAIFGEKAAEVRDTSLKVPPGMEGTVIGVKVFSRKGADKDHRSKTIEDQEVAKLEKDRDDEIRIIKDSCFRRVKSLLLDKSVAANLTSERGRKVLLPKGKKITEELLDKVPRELWDEIRLAEGKDLEAQIEAILEKMTEQVDLVKTIYAEKVEKVKKVDELPPGVIKMVKVYIAMKRKLQVGDKMAGRHGNKGVLSRILPEEDMPYLEDGTPVDMVLNPLGVPSRMNVGQILETHLGLAARALGAQLDAYLRGNYNGQELRRKLDRIYSSPTIKRLLDEMSDEEVLEIALQVKEGIYMSSPVFDGAQEAELKQELARAGLPLDGRVTLFDGRTGEPFDQKVTVGVMYMMKLHHLVDDKLHARSIGPYSLVTQQPLGGKAQFGGQRFGEMEVWALEAYGAAYTLQELLTVKSDDIPGRTRIYEAIVKGQNTLEAGLPESFNVLIKELQSLALNVELLEEEDNYGRKSL